jgi:glycerol-3-phosphate acyltransferase PlsY
VRPLLVLLGYGCGSVPWGVVLARLAGVDVRRVGSGNIGAANVARSAGIRLGVATLAADAAKGALPVLLARRLAGDPETEAATGLAAFLGHVFPVALGFAGGKGVATALGVLLVLAPGAAGVALAVFVAVFAATRRVSVGSMAGVASAAVTAGLARHPPATVAAATIMAVVVVVRHRENIARLRTGTEPRFQLHKNQAAPKN